MGHDELVQKLLKEKGEISKPQTLKSNPPPQFDFTEAGNIPNPGMNQESFLQCSQVMLQGLADKGIDSYHYIATQYSLERITTSFEN